MKIAPIRCIQSVYYLSNTDRERAMSEWVNIDIHHSKYDQYLVGFTQLFNIQEKHGEKTHTLWHKFSYYGPLLANVFWFWLEYEDKYTESPKCWFHTSAKKSQYNVKRFNCKCSLTCNLRHQNVMNVKN